MTRLASESLDRDLRRLERAALRTHLLTCSPCRRYVRQITALNQAMRRIARLDQNGCELPLPTLPTDVRERIKERMKREEAD